MIRLFTSRRRKFTPALDAINVLDLEAVVSRLRLQAVTRHEFELAAELGAVLEHLVAKRVGGSS